MRTADALRIAEACANDGEFDDPSPLDTAVVRDFRDALALLWKRERSLQRQVRLLRRKVPRE